MGKIAVGLRLNRELLDRVNEARGDVPKNRWIERAIEKALDGDPNVPVGYSVVRTADLPPMEPSASKRPLISPNKLKRFG